ncbi:MAG: radical SAM protein [Planctomycetota bacterium]|nr:radical SAM protein [Planctomycetota bacterium]
MAFLEMLFGRKQAVMQRPVVDLSWVREWIKNVYDYIEVREEDSVFIQRPNKAFKLNPEGIRLIKRLREGESIEQILAPWGDNPAVWRDTERFLLDLRTMLKEGLNDTYESLAVDKIPFTMDFSPYPVLSEVAITYRCNATCTFCYAGCNCTVNPVGNDREMTLDEVKQVLHKIKHEAKVPSVSFTGGEATLRPELPEMVAYARSLGMRVNLISNGLRSTPEFVKKLADAGLHSVQISIEGTTAEVHEGITRIPGHYKRAVEGVANYKAAGVRVNTNTTITKTNLHDVVKFPEFVANTLGNQTFSMNLVIPTGSANLNEELVVKYTELGPVLEQILEGAKKHGVEFKWYSPTPMCIFNPILHGLGNKGCSACDGLVSVGADGQVIPCASYDDPVGDIIQGSFDEVWNSEKANNFRKKFLAHDICKGCEHFQVCHGACPLYWRVIGFDEIEQANKGKQK